MRDTLRSPRSTVTQSLRFVMKIMGAERGVARAEPPINE